MNHHFYPPLSHVHSDHQLLNLLYTTQLTNSSCPNCTYDSFMYKEACLYVILVFLPPQTNVIIACCSIPPLSHLTNGTPAKSTGNVYFANYLPDFSPNKPDLHTPDINLLTPNDDYSGRTALLTSKRCILYIYSTHKGTE